MFYEYSAASKIIGSAYRKGQETSSPKRAASHAPRT